MGKGFDLKALYPERDIFHITEFMAMQTTAVSFYVETGNLDQAESRLELIKEVDPAAPEIEQMQTRIVMEKTKLRWLKNSEMSIRTKVDFSPLNFERPAFNFAITEQLFNYGLTVPENVWQQFLDNDRKKVLEDLENLLKDQYFNFDENQGYPEHEAVINVVFILGELEAEESLPTILEMMGQTEAFFDIMLGDTFSELGWIPLVKIGKNKLSLLEEYLKQPAKHTHFRVTVTDALAQIYQHFPEKRKQIITIYERILDFYDKTELKDNIIDNEFNGLLVADLIDLNLKQLLPQIKSLYEKEYVHPTICGPYEEVEKELKSEKRDTDNYKRELLSLKDIYKDLAQYKASYLDEPSNDLSKYEFKSTDSFERKDKKIGRNEPCPCGSGKKFKKCCLGKGIYD